MDFHSDPLKIKFQWEVTTYFCVNAVTTRHYSAVRAVGAVCTRPTRPKAALSAEGVASFRLHAT